MITLNVTIPDGYEATGEYRSPKVGDWFLAEETGTAANAYVNFVGKRIILRKKWAFPAWFKTGCKLWYDSEVSNWLIKQPDFGRFMFADALWAFHGETFVAPPVQMIQCVR